MLLIEKIQREIQDLPEEAQAFLIDFIEILKKRYTKTEKPSSSKSLYEKFEKSGFIGCMENTEDLDASKSWTELIDSLSGAWANDFPTLEEIRSGAGQDILRERF